MNSKTSELMNEIGSIMYQGMPEKADKMMLYLRAGEDFAEQAPRYVDGNGDERSFSTFAELKSFDPQRRLSTLAIELHQAWREDAPAWTWLLMEVDRDGGFKAHPHYEPLESLHDVVPVLQRN